jgi:uncharacterized protein (DUF1501 family)
MHIDRTSRREFLRRLACLAASGGAAALVPQLRMLGTALAATSTFTDYKALVCVYLAGGNDGWNTLIPYDQSRYDVYASSRSGVYDPTTNPGGLALNRAQLTPLTGVSGSGSANYALHPAMPELAALYDSQQLALVVNAGTLVRPITMTDYNSTPADRPPQLFSHSDQENLWHVGTAADNKVGWGGSSMVTLETQFPPGGNTLLSPCISISGSNKFEVGSSVFPYQLATSGISSLSGVCNPPAGCSTNSTARDTALTALLGDAYASELFAGEYAKVFQRGRDLYSVLSSGLASSDGTISTVFPSNNSLGDQLLMVARMIKLSRAQAYAARQIYYVRFGGFDLHSGLMSATPSGHAGLLGSVSAALNAFWNALNEIGAQNNVTAFTMSEFARTLSSNGNGSDHGWGGLQLVLGGAVHGGQLYADGGGPITGFPDQTFNDGTMTFSRGQCIPGIGVEQYAATLAQWMGVTAASDLNAIFPNLPQFGVSNLGFV